MPGGGRQNFLGESKSMWDNSGVIHRRTFLKLLGLAAPAALAPELTLPAAAATRPQPAANNSRLFVEEMDSGLVFEEVRDVNGFVVGQIIYERRWSPYKQIRLGRV
jgi:hypothetical protein